MDFNKFIPTRISNIFSNNSNPNEPSSSKKKNLKISERLKQNRIFITDVEQKDLRDAIMMAENSTYPNRYRLYMIYKEIMRDFHLRSQVRTAILKVVGEPWAMVDKKTKEVNKEATEILQKKWFEDCSKFKLEAEFYGHSLIEFKELVPTEDPEQRKITPFEFKKVTLIPREHVRPETGEVLIQPNDNTGIPYRDGNIPGTEWLIEAGDDYDLGTLEVAARYSIYKKYAIGDMAKSSEKWGDPLLVIKNSSDDKKETDAKADMASNFGNNSWIILDDDDEVTLLERKNGTGYQIFTDLIKASNEENSKGVNGQVGTADSKAFVGAAEVQERILDDYSEARLRSLFYWHNDVTVPFLISKGYKLDGLVWMPYLFLNEMKKENEDDEPDPTKKEGEEPDNTDPDKNPKNKVPGKTLGLGDKRFTQAINNYYTCACGTTHLAPANVINQISIDKLIDAGIRRYYDSKVKSGGIDRELATYNISKLTEAVNGGFNTSKMKFGSTEHRIYMQMRYNASVGMAFKQYQNSLEVVNQLFEGGKIKPFHQFKKDVKPLLETFNKNHLRTEYNLAKNSARAAAKWATFEPDDMLEYKTIGDGRVREEHAILNGTILPTSDLFWQTYYPPNGFGCRCYVRNKGKNATAKNPEGLPELKKGFDRNVGIDGKLLDEQTHPYFEILPEHRKQAERVWGLGLPISSETFLSNVNNYLRYSSDDNYKLIHTNITSGGAVFEHINADKRKLKIYKQELNAAKRMANNGYVIEMAEYIEGKNVNPDYIINGITSDAKITTGSLSNGFKEAQRQGLDNFIIDVKSNRPNLEYASELKSGFHNRKTINTVYVLFDNKLVKVTREIYEKGLIMKILEEKRK